VLFYFSNYKIYSKNFKSATLYVKVKSADFLIDIKT